MPRFTVVSMYTPNTVYEDHLKHLDKSCRSLGIKLRVFPIKNTGNWSKNCQQKSQVLKTALNQLRSPVVWLDADAIVEKEPVLFNNMKSDFAYHILERTGELLSGTLYLKYNKKVLALVDEWINLNSTNENWDQRNLQKLIETKYNKILNIEILPKEYCKIFDNESQKTENPVIVHYQASRLARANGLNGWKP